MRTLFLLLIILPAFALCGQTKELSINAPGCLLKGTLTKAPDSLVNGKKNLVIIVAGSGPTDRNCGRSNAYYFLARDLSQKGISCFRYDKRAVGESEDSLDDLTKIQFNDMVKDLVQIIKYFKKNYNYDGIYLAGHSEGSLIAIIAAERVPVSGLISIAGSAIKAGDLIDKQLVVSINHTELRKRALKINSQLKKGRQPKNIDIELYALFNPLILSYLIEWYKYNPCTEIKRLTVPVLIIQGDNDLQVGEENGRKLHKAAKKSTYVMIKNMNHVLKEVTSKERKENLKTYFDREIEIMPEVAASIAGFINQQNK